MRTIIAGSRNIKDYNTLLMAVGNLTWNITCVISGTAIGVDRLGELYAMRHNISCEKYPADWNQHGKSAGYKRNELMADNAEALLAIWDGQSKGTKHMIDIAKRKGLEVCIYRVTI